MTTTGSAGIVIIGAGLAGGNAVEELREKGYGGPITLIGAEQHRPYERPPLSKDLLLGNAEPDSVYTEPTEWYADHDVTLRLGTPVTGIDTAARKVTVGSDEIEYDKLLIATGSRARHLPPADDSGAPVRYLRTLEDSEQLKADLAGNLVIIGAGWIGLEVASAARQAGGTVTVVEAAPRVLGRVLNPELSEMFAGLHREHGVDLRLDTTVTNIAHNDDGTTVTLSDGTELHPDQIVVGIGVEPVDDLAASAGLATDHGILVDARLQTADPNIFAAGDVALHDHPTLGRLRVEHWDAAIQHGRHAARAMLGDEAPYEGQPYFFTDQYDLGMEYVGHADATKVDEVVIRGDRDARVVTALWIKDNRVVAGMHTNDWDAIEPIRAVVGKEATDAIRDPSVPLAEAIG